MELVQRLGTGFLREIMACCADQIFVAGSWTDGTAIDRFSQEVTIPDNCSLGPSMDVVGGVVAPLAAEGAVRVLVCIVVGGVAHLVIH